MNLQTCERLIETIIGDIDHETSSQAVIRLDRNEE
jgi:hypothetical protein